MKRWSILFLLSNVLLFIPIYLAYGPIATLLPFNGIRNVEQEGILSILFLNHNYNPFRIVADWSICLLIAPYIQRFYLSKRVLTGLLAGIWLFFFLFQLYFGAMHYLYGTKPQLVNEWILVAEVLPVFAAGVGVSFILVLFIALLIGIGLYWLVRQTIMFSLSDQPVIFRRYLVLAVSFFIMMSAWRYRDADIYDLRLNSQFLLPRIVDAIRSEDVKKMENLTVRSLPYNAYNQLQLHQPPNIYLIFVESYGAVPFLSKALQDTFLSHNTAMAERLEDEGWLTSSTWSLAPIKGGRSWLSFSSALTGLHIDNQLAYNELLDMDFRYPHLVRFLNSMGYVSHRINTMQTNEITDKHIPYDKIRDFHEFDTWTLFQDIPYRGYPYNPIGGLPDQYALEYVYSKRIKGKSGPHFLFFITLDSHAPWYPPPTIVNNYKTLDSITSSPHGTYQNLDADIMDRYRDCMFYELGFLEHFIRTKGTDSDMFILVGDHQPPAMEHLIWDQINDFAVPLHFIQKNSLVQSKLASLEFNAGLIPASTDTVEWTHAGIYSLVAHILSSCYTTDVNRSTPIKKKGI
jgi:hypothetical protein